MLSNKTLKLMNQLGKLFDKRTDLSTKIYRLEQQRKRLDIEINKKDSQYAESLKSDSSV